MPNLSMGETFTGYNSIMQNKTSFLPQDRAFMNHNNYANLSTETVLPVPYVRSISTSKSKCSWWSSKRKDKKGSCPGGEEESWGPTKLNIQDKCWVPSTWIQPKIVIIGAGMAGLSAAQRLVQCGLVNFVILEATDRAGGRVHSSWFADCVAELGAMWIMGASHGNSAYNLAASEGLIKCPMLHQPPTEGYFYTRSGRVLGKQLVRSVYSTFCRIESKALRLLDREHNDYESLESFMKQQIYKDIKNFPGLYRDDVEMILNGYLNALRVRFGQDLSCVNTIGYASVSNIPGGNIRVPLGFGGILAPLVRDIPECAMIYCMPVQSIMWNPSVANSPRCVVKCCDGAQYPADYVIVTTSLGFLKSKIETFFCPQLSQKKTEAIKKLGFGHCDKIFLSFKDSLWRSDEGNMYLAWSSCDLEDRNHWLKGVDGFTRAPDSEQVLYSHVAGKEAIEMGRKSDEEIAQDVQTFFQMLTGDSTLGRPSDILRSKWSTSEYFQGAYTYLGLDSGTGHILDIAEPVPEPCTESPPVLLFAGEHTCHKHFGTVHGARNTGIREANRIINFTHKFKGPPTKVLCLPCP